MNDTNRALGEAWHSLSAQATAETLGANPASGLSSEEAAARLARHGENRLAETPPRPVWLKLLDQFRSYLVIVLLFAAVLASAIGDLKDAVVILVVVVLNAVLGFYQEHRAERTLAALKGMLAPRARVRRDGHVKELDAAELGAGRPGTAGGGRPGTGGRAARCCPQPGGGGGGSDRRVPRRG